MTVRGYVCLDWDNKSGRPMHRHPGPVLGGRGLGSGEHLDGDDPGGEVGTGARLEGALQGPSGRQGLVWLLAGEDELGLLSSGRLPVIPALPGGDSVRPQASLDGLPARRRNLL